jgi:hypothetical protein
MPIVCQTVHYGNVPACLGLVGRHRESSEHSCRCNPWFFRYLQIVAIRANVSSASHLTGGYRIPQSREHFSSNCTSRTGTLPRVSGSSSLPTARAQVTLRREARVRSCLGLNWFSVSRRIPKPLTLCGSSVRMSVQDRCSLVSHLYPKPAPNPHKTTQFNPTDPLLSY